MEKTIERLKGHTYLNKKGEPIKNPRIKYEEVLEAYSYLITILKGKVSQRILRLAFTDKSKDFTNILLDTGYIKKLRESNTISIKFEDGTSKYVSTTNVFSNTKEIKKVKENKYIDSLYKKIKVKEEYQWLTEKIEDTLSRTTLDGKQIGTEIQFNKGRYYGPHSIMSKEIRKRLRIDNEETHSLDIRFSIFQLLSKNNIEGIKPISNITLNNDFYKRMERDFGLDKEELLKQVFCHQSQQVKELDIVPFFSSLRDFKIKYGYKFVHYVYQLCETKLMTEIYQLLRMNSIDFLPMHDSVIFKVKDTDRVLDIVNQITRIEFKLEY